MEIKFIKEYRALLDDNTCRTYRAGQTWSVNITVAQWLIDNGFAEKAEDTKGGWKPKLGDIYYVAYPDGLIASCTWDGCTVDLNRFLNGAAFKTKEATRRWRDYLRAVATVRQDEGVLTPEEIRDVSWDQPMSYVGVSLDNELGVCQKNVEDEVVIAGAIYFDTKEHAQASLDEHPDEWKIIANYDWSRE